MKRVPPCQAYARVHLTDHGTSVTTRYTATSVDTDNVIDLKCWTKYYSCPKAYVEKVPINNCSSSYVGSSGVMETEGTVRIFNRSIQSGC